MNELNLATDARLSEAVYKKVTGVNGNTASAANHPDNTSSVDGWNPISVDLRNTLVSPTFGAQLYEKNGQYKIAFRGTEGNLADWAENFKYGTFQWSDEYRDTVVFTANAILQVAKNFPGQTPGDIASLFTTTGHSQGGFQAELAALLFNLQGTSLDGMGAAGVVAQYRDRLTQVMHDMGVGDLAGEHTLSNDAFLTRIYSPVGRLGVHAGATDGAWSWSLTKLLATTNPALLGAGLLVGLRAHAIGDIAVNEELRQRSPLWQMLGDSGSDPAFGGPAQLAGDIADRWAATLVAGSDGAFVPEWPDTAPLRAQLAPFLQERAGERYDLQTLGHNILIRTERGDTLTIYADGRTTVSEDRGGVLTLREYAADGQLIAARQQRPDGRETMVHVDAQGTRTTTEWNAPHDISEVNVTDARGVLISRTHTEYFVDEDGISSFETVTTANGTVGHAYGSNGQLFASGPVNGGATTLWTDNFNGPASVNPLFVLNATPTDETIRHFRRPCIRNPWLMKHRVWIH